MREYFDETLARFILSCFLIALMFRLILIIVKGFML